MNIERPGCCGKSTTTTDTRTEQPQSSRKVHTSSCSLLLIMDSFYHFSFQVGRDDSCECTRCISSFLFVCFRFSGATENVFRVNGWKTINAIIITVLVLHLKYLWMNGSFKTNKGGLSKVYALVPTQRMAAVELSPRFLKRSSRENFERRLFDGKHPNLIVQ